MVRPCKCPWMTAEEGLLVPAQGEQLGEGEWGDNLGRQFISMDTTDTVYG